MKEEEVGRFQGERRMYNPTYVLPRQQQQQHCLSVYNSVGVQGRVTYLAPPGGQDICVTEAAASNIA